MPHLTKPVVGTFCWFEITTTDVAMARKLYGELFGWAFQEMPMPDGTKYTIAQLGGKNVGGLSALTTEAMKMKVPPHFLPHVAVNDADAAVSRATSLGGVVLLKTVDSPPGRMAILQDPTGGVFAVWQEKQSMGGSLYGENGARCWDELGSTDPAKASAFYSALFGWRTEAMPAEGMTYTLFKNGSENVGGMMPSPKGAPSAWTCYLQVADADQAITRAKKMGGKVIAPAMDAKDVGRFAVLQDVQGAVFGILQPPKR